MAPVVAVPDLMSLKRMFLITSTSGGPGRQPARAMELREVGLRQLTTLGVEVAEASEVLEEEVVAVEDGTLELVAVKFQEPEVANL